MQIFKILNTNAVISKDHVGNYILCLGNGLGFKKRNGDQFNKEKIEREFILKDRAQMAQFEEILASIPPEYILLAEKAIDYAKDVYHMELNESIHLALVDHMYNAVCNYLDGVSIPNSLLDDIRRFYPNEYALGRRTWVLIKEKFGYELPQDEIGFFALHFVTAQQTEENINSKKMVTFVRKINDLIQEKLNLVFDEESLPYYRYMSHLKSFAQRVIQDVHYSDEDSSEVAEALVRKYPKEYECSKEVCRYIRESFGYHAGRDEEIFLAVHLARLSQ